MALVGGLVLAVSARYAKRHPEGSLGHRLRPHLAFQFGRVLGFTLFGGLLGLLGSSLSVSGRPLAFFMILVAVVMGLVGVQLTHVSPRLGGGLTLPPLLATKLGLDRVDGGYVDARAALLGAGSFLLPCGFTQAVQVYALSTGDPIRGALIMGGFALGT